MTPSNRRQTRIIRRGTITDDKGRARRTRCNNPNIQESDNQTHRLQHCTSIHRAIQITDGQPRRRKQISDCIAASSATTSQAEIAGNSIYIPAVAVPLVATYISEETLTKIENKAITKFLPKMEYKRNTQMPLSLDQRV